MKTINKQNTKKSSTENILYGINMFISDVNLNPGKDAKYYPGTDSVSSLLFDEYREHNNNQIANGMICFSIDLKDYFMK